MEQLRNALANTFPAIDFDKEKALVDDGLIDSLAIVSIIAIIEDLYDVSVTMEYIQAPYFQSVETMWDMVEELR